MSSGFTGVYNSPLNQNSTNQHFQSTGTLTSDGNVPPSSSATSSSSTWYQPLQTVSNLKASTSEEVTSTKQPTSGKRTSEELAIMAQNLERWVIFISHLDSHVTHPTCRLNARIASDQMMLLHPDIDSAFVDETDVVQRLLPYHVFQQPKEDLAGISAKGKGRAQETSWEEEIQGKTAYLFFF